MTREEMLGVAMGVGSSILPSFANRVLFADAVMQFGLWVEHQSAQDLRTQLAESKIKTRTTQAKLENMATECGQAEGLLRRCREDLAEAQAKNTEDKNTLTWAIGKKDKQLQQWQDDYQKLAEKQSTLEAGAVELRKDRARLEWYLTHSNCVICKMDGKYALYLGPSPSTKWYNSPRKAIDEAMEKSHE